MRIPLIRCALSLCFFFDFRPLECIMRMPVAGECRLHAVCSGFQAGNLACRGHFCFLRRKRIPLAVPLAVWAISRIVQVHDQPELIPQVVEITSLAPLEQPLNRPQAIIYRLESFGVRRHVRPDVSRLVAGVVVSALKVVFGAGNGRRYRLAPVALSTAEKRSAATCARCAANATSEKETPDSVYPPAAWRACRMQIQPCAPACLEVVSRSVPSIRKSREYQAGSPRES